MITFIASHFPYYAALDSMATPKIINLLFLSSLYQNYVTALELWLTSNCRRNVLLKLNLNPSSVEAFTHSFD